MFTVSETNRSHHWSTINIPSFNSVGKFEITCSAQDLKRNQPKLLQTHQIAESRLPKPVVHPKSALMVCPCLSVRLRACPPAGRLISDVWSCLVA